MTRRTGLTMLASALIQIGLVLLSLKFPATAVTLAFLNGAGLIIESEK